MFDLISLGTISVDLYFKDDSLTLSQDRFQLALGGKYNIGQFYEAVGGGGANVAIGIERHGLQAAVMSKIGNNPFKSMIIDKLERESVFHRYCHYEEGYYNISSILVAPNGERTVLHHQTEHKHLFKDNDEIHKLKRAHAVYIGNIPDDGVETRMQILEYLKVNNIQSILNLGITDCRRSKRHLLPLLDLADILIINGHEFAEIVKAQYKDIDFTEHVIDFYIPRLKDQLVVITEGENGSYAYLNDVIMHQPAIKPHRIVDTTGAGDAYTAAFLASYIKTHNIRQSMMRGATYASKILGKIGAN